MTTAEEAERLLLGEQECRACGEWEELNTDGLCPSCWGNYFRCRKCDRLYENITSTSYDCSCCHRCDPEGWERSYRENDCEDVIEDWTPSVEGLVDESR